MGEGIRTTDNYLPQVRLNGDVLWNEFKGVSDRAARLGTTKMLRPLSASGIK